MKLASLKSGRDGRLMVVDAGLTRWAPAEGIDTLRIDLVELFAELYV